MPAKKALIPPTQPDQPSVLHEVSPTGPEFLEVDEWDGVLITNADFSDCSANGVRVVGSTLERVELAGSRFPNLKLTDVRLTGCNLANMEGRGGSMLRVVARNCRFTGLQWVEGRMRDVTFLESRFDLASFAASQIESVSFEDCVFREGSLQGATLRSVSFVNCDLTGADFGGANVANCEMRGCTLDGVRGIDRLRGLKMPWSDIVANAGTFAEALGIAVLDDK